MGVKGPPLARRATPADAAHTGRLTHAYLPEFVANPFISACFHILKMNVGPLFLQ
jgi:hypothetical protein